MKVIHVLNHFLPYQTAGTEVYTWALIRNLRQTALVQASILIPNYGKEFNEYYHYDGIEVTRYAEPSVVDRKLIMGIRKPDGLLAFEQYLQENKPDIVHFHELAGSNGVTLWHVKAAKKNGARVVITFHLASYSCATGTLVYKDQQLCDGKINLYKCSKCYLQFKGQRSVSPFLLPVSFLLYKAGVNTTKWNNKPGTALGTVYLIHQLKQKFKDLINTCDKVVVLTDWYKKILELNEVQPGKIALIKQALPTDTVEYEKKGVREGSLPIKLVFVGRISPFKGLHILLSAVLKFSANEIELDIYGSSNDNAYESEWKEKTKSKANIRWKGAISPDAVVNTLSEYDALCLCSTFSEMSPLVIQEAFAAGIPVIASNVYGNAEQIVHDQNGLLFRFKDVESLKDQLARCVRDPFLLPGLRQNIKAPRSFSETGNAYYALYKTLLN